MAVEHKHFWSPSRRAFYIDQVHGNDGIPTDAVAITADQKRDLLEAQATGKVINVVNGEVVATDKPGLTKDELTFELRSKRNRLLVASDWTQMPDADLTDSQRAAWKKYRQALRDLTDTTKDPAKVVWPTTPA